MKAKSTGQLFYYIKTLFHIVIKASFREVTLKFMLRDFLHSLALQQTLKHYCDVCDNVVQYVRDK